MKNPFQYVRFCAWGGPLLLVITILFWGVLGHNIPPYSAALEAADFAAQFKANMMSIRIGMDVTLAASVFYMTWGMAITKVMEVVERETGTNNVLSTLQLWGAGLTTMIFVLPVGIWLTATFRADVMTPETLRMIYDLGWMIFDLSFTLTTLQMVALGVCFLNDGRQQPLVPKWVSWLSIWVGIMFFIEMLNPFFKSGPFSRSGVLNYWIEFTLFFLFMAVVSAAVLKAITRLELEHAAGARG